MQSCAVIGCGPAGIAASTLLRQSGLLVTCFELNCSPGGMWVLDSRQKFSDRGSLLSPVYPSMRCALPKDLMSFSDYGFDFTVPQFPHHSSVQHYLTQYASAKGVTAITRFNTKVQSVRHDERDDQWKVVTVNLTNGDVLEWSFDKVCVCTGQTQTPRWPTKKVREVLDAYRTAGGEVDHACYLKDFRALRRKRVLVIGDGVSASDYCQGLHAVGAKVYHCTDKLESYSPNPILAQSSSLRRRTLQGHQQSKYGSSSLTSSFLKHVSHQRQKLFNRNITRVGSLRRCEGKALVFQGCISPSFSRGTTSSEDLEGEILVDHVDFVVCATGYTQTFPFLHPSVRRVVEDETETSVPLLPTEKTRNTTENHIPANKDEGSCSDSLVDQLPSQNAGNRRGLYLGTLWQSNPSLAFVGLQKELLPPFLLYEMQSRFVSYAFTKRLPIPPNPTEMLQKELTLEAQYALNLCVSPFCSPSDAKDIRHHASGVEGLHEKTTLNSANYYDVLLKELNINSKDTYNAVLARRRRWWLPTTFLRLYHKCRSFAPLKRKQQHLLFSNKV